jgi:hypothetical protein
VPEKWRTMTVTDDQSRRPSLDVQAPSTFDTAHIYLCNLKEHPEKGLPRPTLANVFEIIIDAEVYRVERKALQRWIVKDKQVVASETPFTEYRRQDP